ncbi:hypothetical protein Gasu_16340 isoform 1 [Galdieria sulphuraria]|uniref:Uncharacterized protein n=1 Tax=Galdieria sulphuraria TaxID=130081 RepID=M2XLS1_GALSU|nr:hypothetical protein Gasu_16340 isoform 1 [Galdieria sulphuraria]EME31137.1 hypothetical protein isoform 1 [Galdieria sulphuraria]|eukprot:XP_005707657.1 hypothetical protein isoform 1 [Galdieria sulphuraria]
MFSDHTQKLQFYGHCSCRRLLGQKAWCRTTNWNNVSRQYFQQKHITSSWPKNKVADRLLKTLSSKYLDRHEPAY